MIKLFYSIHLAPLLTGARQLPAKARLLPYKRALPSLIVMDLPVLGAPDIGRVWRA